MVKTHLNRRRIISQNEAEATFQDIEEDRLTAERHLETDDMERQ